MYHHAREGRQYVLQGISSHFLSHLCVVFVHLVRLLQRPGKTLRVRQSVLYVVVCKMTGVSRYIEGKVSTPLVAAILPHTFHLPPSARPNLYSTSYSAICPPSRTNQQHESPKGPECITTALRTKCDGETAEPHGRFATDA